jgi:hypothetical protein
MNINIPVIVATTLFLAQTASAQTPPAASQTKTAPASTSAPASSAAPVQPISHGLGAIVYPAKGQSSEKQSVDEQECYNWSKTQTGIDPQAPPVQPATEPAPGPRGQRVKSAARGAAAGAVIGEVADNDADQGARVGATAGVLAGGHKTREQKRAEEEKAKADTQATQTGQQATFKKAFGTCMTGRGYTTG